MKLIELFHEVDSNSWCHRFVAERLMRLGPLLNGAPLPSDLSHVLGGWSTEVMRAYRRRALGPLAAAHLLILCNFLTEIAKLEEPEKVRRHMVIAAAQALQEELLKDVADLPQRCMARTLWEVRYVPALPAWRAMIQACFYDYQEPRRRIIEASDSVATWVLLIGEVLPFLWMASIVPIYEQSFTDGGDVYAVRIGLDPPEMSDNVIREPTPLYRRTFDDAERAAHGGELKMIEETYAHLFATASSWALFGDAYFDQIAEGVKKLAADEGKLAARQRILVLHRQQLAAPRYMAEQLKNAIEAGG